MANKTTQELIEEMQEVKAAHPTLEISDILRIFNIKAMNDLNLQIKLKNNKI